MKIFLVIHGYPMRYNAGSEVYTQGLAQALAHRHEVHVFTRQQNSFLPDYEISEEVDPTDPRVKVYVVNVAQNKDRYRHAEVDKKFGELLDRIKPEIVHIGHLSHLSTSLVLEAKKRDVPIVFTLHDYWLMCPRGQFIQARPKNPIDAWAACDGQEDHKCAERCYTHSFSGAPGEIETDIAYWTDWVHRRMVHIREVCEAVDLFIAPSRYLLQRFRDEFGLSENKLVYLDYGFHLDRLVGRHRTPGEPFTFGYIGTHIPAKGVNHLIEAFGRLSGTALLRIWGRPRGTETEGLQLLVKRLPDKVQERIVPVASDVKISWNGARKETQEAIMLGTRWEKVLENVRIFIKVRDTHAAQGGNRCRVTFQLTFLETNVGELAAIIKLAV